MEQDIREQSLLHKLTALFMIGVVSVLIGAGVYLVLSLAGVDLTTSMQAFAIVSVVMWILFMLSWVVGKRKRTKTFHPRDTPCGCET